MLLAVVLDVLGLDVEVVVVTACAGCLLDALLETACFTTFVLDVQLLVVLLLLLLVVEELFHLLVNLLLCPKSLFFGVLTVVFHSLLLFF